MKRYLILALCLSGCVVGPDYQEPKVDTPKQWSAPSSETTGKLLATWWKQFNDPILNELINDAVQSNLDLKQATERIKAAREQRIMAVASALPSIGTKNNINRRLNSAATTSSTQQAGGFGFGNQTIDILQLGLDAQWEIDFFGGAQRAIEAADATINSEIEQRRDVLVSLLGEIARLYIELRGNQQLIAITEANIKDQQDTLHLLQVRYQAGLADQSEIAQAEAELASIQAQIPNYQALIQQAVHGLSVLLAKQPNDLTAKLTPVKNIPTVKQKVLPDLPSELLKRRPDIRYAERQLAVANAQIGIATTELYPKFNLSAFLGLQNTKITDMTLLGRSWSAGTTLAMPIFNWGKINANIRTKEAGYQQQLLNYQKTVLTAFKEVEDALVAYDKEQQKQHSLEQAVTANQQAVKLATERYEKGLNNFLSVLTSQQMLHQAQTNLINSQAKQSANIVMLYKVLGGGWQGVQ